MSNDLFIIDRSGSMEGERFEKCRTYVNNTSGMKDIWLFGDDVQKERVTNLSDVPCNQGTDIKNMLNKLHTYLCTKKNMRIHILTDDEDNYEPKKFKVKFDQLLQNNFEFVIANCCGTNVEKMRQVFSSFSPVFSDDFKELLNLQKNLSTLIQQTKQISTMRKNITEKTKELKEKFVEISEKRKKLEEKYKQISKKTRDFKTKHAEAIKTKEIPTLKKIDNEYENHIDQILSGLDDTIEAINGLKKIGIDIYTAEKKITWRKKLIRTASESMKKMHLRKILNLEKELEKLVGQKKDILSKYEIEEKDLSKQIEDISILRDEIEQRKSELTNNK